MLAAPAVVHAHDASVAKSKKTTLAKTVKSGRVEVDGIQYHYQIRGQGAPIFIRN